ncbi:MAG: iron-sulfur cluster insertion protein ErpA [Herpetosiphon sp.]
MATAPATELITVTPSAAVKLRTLMDEKQMAGHALRVFVAGGGCSGLQYGMTFDNETHVGDTEFDAAGLPVRIDPISAKYIMGAHIDYTDSLMGGGFKIDNPNAVASCGCGSSFRPKEAAEEPAPAAGCGSGCGCH